MRRIRPESSPWNRAVTSRVSLSVLPVVSRLSVTLSRLSLARTLLLMSVTVTSTVSLGVGGSLSQEDRLFLGGNTELVVEGVMPDLLHIIPVGDDTMLNGVLQGEDTSLGLGFISNIGILLTHTDHDTLVAGTSNNGGEDSTG